MSTTTEKLLLVDDDENFGYVMQRALSRRGLAADYFNSASAALSAAEIYAYPKAIVDLKIAQESGLALIKQLKRLNPHIDIIMLTGYSSVSTAVEAIKLGALNYFCKPIDLDEILSAFNENDSTLADEPNLELNAELAPPSLDRMEWELIQKTLLANDGNISATARALGMHRRTLQRKLLKRPSQQ